MIAIYAANSGFADDVELRDISRFEEELIAFVNAREPSLKEEILSGKKLDEKQIARLRSAIEAFKATFK